MFETATRSKTHETIVEGQRLRTTDIMSTAQESTAHDSTPQRNPPFLLVSFSPLSPLYTPLSPLLPLPPSPSLSLFLSLPLSSSLSVLSLFSLSAPLLFSPVPFPFSLRPFRFFACACSFSFYRVCLRCFSFSGACFCSCFKEVKEKSGCTRQHAI